MHVGIISLSLLRILRLDLDLDMARSLSISRSIRPAGRPPVHPLVCLSMTCLLTWIESIAYLSVFACMCICMYDYVCMSMYV